jgi:signal transduction histidine kinase
MRYLATYLIYIAVLTRAIGWNQETAPISTTIWIMLAVFGVILFSEHPITRRFSRFPRWYTLVQSILVIAMLYRSPTLDFLDLLFFPLSFQAVQFFHDYIGFACIGGYSLAMAGLMFFGMEWEAGLTMILTATGGNLLMGSFAHLIARTEQQRQENQRFFRELQQAYHQLKDSTAQTEALAAATERHHLVRELHDSLTQTLFSMNLAVQSAQLSMTDIPQQAEEHLSRLQTLAHNAAKEVQNLTGQTSYRSLTKEGLIPALQRMAEERLVQDGLKVTVEWAGDRVLPESTNVNLYRITQEALNNITRHSGAHQALVKIDLLSPLASIEIIDKGCGFDSSKVSIKKGFGLVGMVERAGEIGWSLQIEAQPGQGTRIRVEEQPS